MAISSTSFKPGNKAAEKHGISRAVKALSNGDEFTGQAREAELAIKSEYDQFGSEHIRKRNRFRLQAVSDLLWLEIVRHTALGDDEKRDGYIKQFIYSTNSAEKAWSEDKSDDELDYEAILQG